MGNIPIQLIRLLAAFPPKPHFFHTCSGDPQEPETHSYPVIIRLLLSAFQLQFLYIFTHRRKHFFLSCVVLKLLNQIPICNFFIVTWMGDIHRAVEECFHIHLLKWKSLNLQQVHSEWICHWSRRNLASNFLKWKYLHIHRLCSFSMRDDE